MASVKRTKVGSACQRCRTQKLKCDIQRPCTLCRHVGAECQPGTTDQWRSFQSPSTGASGRSNTKGKRTAQRRTQKSQDREPSDRRDPSLAEQQPWSSSTMSLVEGAFNFHNSSTPDSSLITALPGAGTRREAGRRSGKLPVSNLRLQEFRTITRDLVSLLPSREVAALLVDTYFDRAHWFTLIFMQEEFRQRWEAMFDSPREKLMDGSSNPAFISTFLVVIAIALRYTGPHRQRLLREFGTDATSLEERIVSTLRVNMLDIVSLASLEAVQTCVLLGTYYLYHGRPDLAWPVCGLGLRLAQALNLHRMLPTAETMTPETQRQYETRKRCWWAIYEIETFCSMSYGYPHAIKEADCDVELLDPLARTSAGQSPASFNTTHQCPTSLLSYKYLMSKLSILINDTLTGLYGIGSFNSDLPSSRSKSSAGLRDLIKGVSSLDSRLQNWKMEIPDLLRMDKLSNSLNIPYSSVEEMDRDIGAKGPGFETHIYQLQALTLELAFQNARILVHRPLLTYKMVPRKESHDVYTEPARQDPFQASLHACREAALSTAEIGTTSIFSLAADTYAATFISIHTFTAGVMLCILASIEPLTSHSHASKKGIRQLLNMQRHLKATARSTLATQGLEILERLTKLVMDKELQEMLADSGHDEPSYHLDEQLPNRTGVEPGDALVATQEPISDEEFIFNYDPAMSKALFDFDQALSNYESEVPLEPLFADSLASGSAFSQEQAWIWGMDNL